MSRLQLEDRAFWHGTRNDAPKQASGAGSVLSWARGWTGRLWLWWRRTAERRLHPPQLALVERIALGPRQTLALVEAEGMRVLVATSAEGAAAFYPLLPASSRHRAPAVEIRSSVTFNRMPGRALRVRMAGRVSW